MSSLLGSYQDPTFCRARLCQPELPGLDGGVTHPVRLSSLREELACGHETLAHLPSVSQHGQEPQAGGSLETLPNPAHCLLPGPVLLRDGQETSFGLIDRKR